MKRLSRQSGMTLIELMLASVLSVIISYFIMNIMITSARTAATSEGLAQAQETGRLVMAWLDEQLSVAGYNSNYQSSESQSPMAALCQAGAPLPPANNAHCTFNADDHGSGGDRIAIRRSTGARDGVTPSDRDIQTCAGEALPAAIVDNQEFVIDVYWVQPNNGNASTTDDYELRCATYEENGTRIADSQAIANGIESLHILVGITDADGNPQRFVSPANVPNWERVAGVRIAVLAREFGDSTFTPDKRAYGLLDADPIEFQDGAARHVQNGTVWFPNTKKL
ncbi:PilW family protein [Venatoribacter cucullus]|uniref:PilW family protein n=1 Tax=Venatoribacter cucullus TaxID=2661630 RepID=UPI00223EAB6C|nr:PilW family protein [Venatoribacter cucullus]UZK02838.1 prepilin-type N-terminal cleavage/methylation domain-containing protein [Venatoribacter cucullus]